MFSLSLTYLQAYIYIYIYIFFLSQDRFPLEKVLCWTRWNSDRTSDKNFFEENQDIKSLRSF